MDLGLRGRVALVAAASRGLGRAIAEELATEGTSLVLCARGAAQLERTRDEIAQRTNVPVTAVVADVSKADDVTTLLEKAFDAFQRVDVLVTNAGGPPPGPFETHSADAWLAAYHLTLESTINLCRGVLPGMKERRWGRIVNVTSIAAKQPVDNLILSNTLRAGVTGFARTLANEIAPFGITVNNILPGYTRTERVEELAALAAFLASDRASYITAQSVAADGGWIRSLL